MKYIELKAATEDRIKELMDKGTSREEAENRTMTAAVAMFNDKVIGFMDLQNIARVLGYGFTGELKKILDDIKAKLRVEHGIDDILESLKEQGASEEEIGDVAAKILIREYENGHIETLELLDMALWTIGYRVCEETFYAAETMEHPPIGFEPER